MEKHAEHQVERNVWGLGLSCWVLVRHSGEGKKI